MRMRGGIKPRRRHKPIINTALASRGFGRIRPVSERRASLMRLYYSRARKFKRLTNCFCAGLYPGKNGGTFVVCAKKYHACTDVHHSRGRAGSLLIDERFWIPVCRRAHNWIQANPERARALGLLCQPGEWNVPVKEGA